MIIL
jgi:GTPase SAR1 family protein